LILQTPASLAAALNLEVRTGHEVIAVDTTKHTVTVRRREDDQEYTELRHPGPVDGSRTDHSAVAGRRPTPGEGAAHRT
jgi:hypothetical protein